MKLTEDDIIDIKEALYETNNDFELVSYRYSITIEEVKEIYETANKSECKE